MQLSVPIDRALLFNQNLSLRQILLHGQLLFWADTHCTKDTRIFLVLKIKVWVHESVLEAAVLFLDRDLDLSVGVAAAGAAPVGAAAGVEE